MKRIFIFSLLLCWRSVLFGQTSATVPSTNAWPTNLPWTVVSNRWAPLPVTEIKQAAEKGELTAKYFLGRGYLDGLGLPKDRSEGLKWMRMASDGGYPHAQMFLGYMYETGDLVPRDHDEAIRLYRLAAEHGDARAQNNLGWAYQKGNGVPEDLAEAVKWYRKSAEQGDELGEANLAWMYSKGDGVERDYELAEKWGHKSAESGNPRLQHHYAEILVNQFAKDGHQIANFAVAAEWYQKAAEQNYTDSQWALANLYYYGKLERDYNLAVKWYTRAANNGMVDAMARLGELYRDNHENFPANHVESARWYRKAAEKGEADAEYELGLLLLEAKEPHDASEAETWLRKAADAGIANAGIKLAELHHESPQSALKGSSREDLNAMAVNGSGKMVLTTAIANDEGLDGPADAEGAAGLYLRVLQNWPDTDKPEAINRFVNLYYSRRLKTEPPARTADFDQRSTTYQYYFWTAPKNEKQLTDIFKNNRQFASPLTKFRVGEMYYRGQPLATNRSAAVEWFKEAAEAGSAEAMNRLGELWAAGMAGQPEPREAFGWYRKAADKGLAAAQLKLGRALEKGEGVDANQVEALAWLQLAANQNSEARQEAESLSARLSNEDRAAAKARMAELAKGIHLEPAK